MLGIVMVDRKRSMIRGNRSFRVTTREGLWFFFFGVFAVSLVSLGQPVGGRPNIVLIVADGLGVDDVSVYQTAAAARTPNIDGLAAQGIRFTDANAPASIAGPSLYAVLTGRYAWRNWLKRGEIDGADASLVEAGRLNLGSMLADEGYRTAFVGQWGLGLEWCWKDGVAPAPAGLRLRSVEDIDFSQPVSGTPLDMGFDESMILPGGASGSLQFLIEGREVAGAPRKHESAWRVEGWGEDSLDTAFFRRATRFIESSAVENREVPFFLLLSLSSPNRESAGGDASREERVARLDRNVGTILQSLSRPGVAERTLVLLTSACGPDRGGAPDAGSRLVRGHKSHVWEGGHRVPLIVRWPGAISSGAVSATPFELTDILATIARLVGVDLDRVNGLDSLDASERLLGLQGGPMRRPAIVSQSGLGFFSIRVGAWKWIENTEGSGGRVDPADDTVFPGSADNGQLYHLSSDPLEARNQFGFRRDVVRELRETLSRIRGADWP